MFTGVCLSMGGYLGRYTPWDQVHPQDQVHTNLDQVHPPPPGTRSPLEPGTPPDQVYPSDQVHPPDQVHPQTSACQEIWATSRQYASYWNAFLLIKFFRQ